MTSKRRQPPSCASWLNVIVNSQPTPAADVQRIMVSVRLAYEKLKAGHGTDQDYDRVGAAINVGMIRAESIDQLLVDVMKKAGEAMLECARLAREHGRFGFRGPHLLDMNAAVDTYQEILGASSPNQMEAAVRECERRIRQREVLTA